MFKLSLLLHLLSWWGKKKNDFGKGNGGEGRRMMVGRGGGIKENGLYRHPSILCEKQIKVMST